MVCWMLVLQLDRYAQSGSAHDPVTGGPANRSKRYRGQRRGQHRRRARNGRRSERGSCDKDHKKTIELFQAAAASPQVDKDLQALASKLLPKLQEHEQMVSQVESKLPSRSASGR
jgi:hypothetical protein